MNERLLTRNNGRIPRLLGHIARAKAKQQPERVKGFQEELDRRYKQMCDAGHKTAIDKVIKATQAELAPTAKAA